MRHVRSGVVVLLRVVVACLLLAWDPAPAVAQTYRGDLPRRVPLPAAHQEPCRDDALPLVIERRAGHPVRFYVRVEGEGGPGLMLLDTGTAKSHLTRPMNGPAMVSQAGRIRVGCRTQAMDGWAERALDPFGGLPVLGSFGADFVMKGTTELDLRSGRLIRWGQLLPDVVRAWPQVALGTKDGMPVTRAVVDGYPLELLVDTGSEDSILMTEDLDDRQATVTTDALGNSLRLVSMTSSLLWGAAPQNVRVSWTRQFPAFQRLVQSWGGTAGLLGVTSLGERRIVFDASDRRLYLEPKA
jgi:hypothetical protein